jgi:hypothetical protein
MMKPWDGTDDPLSTILGQFFDSTEEVRIVDLSGIPNEIAGTTSAAIARALFSVKLWQTPEERQNSPILTL